MESTLIFQSTNSKQVDVLSLWQDKTVREIVYGGAKACGKSYLGSFILLSMALTYPNTAYFVARKRLTDIVKFFLPSWNEVAARYVKQDKFKINLQRNIISFTNLSTIFLLECKYLPQDPLYARFGSMQITQGWIEEAGEVDKEAKANLQASIGRWKNTEYNLPPKLLLTCNPSPNFLFDTYKLFAEKALPNDVAFVPALPTDNPHIPKEYIDNLYKSLSPSQAKRLLHGQWEFESTNNLFKYDKILNAINSTDSPPVGARYLACDVAIGGDDHTCLLLCVTDSHSYYVSILTYTQGLDANGLFSEIKKQQHVYNINNYRTAFDADGVGGYLRSFLPAGSPYRAGAKASRENFSNKRSECLFFLAKLFDEQCITIRCSSSEGQQLLRELSVVEETIGKKGIEKLDCTPKADIKALIGNSPDILDALTIAMSFFVEQEGTGKSYIGF